MTTTCITIITILTSLIVADQGQPVVHTGTGINEIIHKKLDKDCQEISSSESVNDSVLIGEKCYFSTAATNLTWHSAWLECNATWQGARLAWFDDNIDARGDILRQAGIYGSFRVAYQYRKPSTGNWVYSRDGSFSPDDPQPLSELCNSSLGAHIFSNGSCYVYNSAQSLTWTNAADSCNQIPGYIGHLAWPLSAEIVEMLKGMDGLAGHDVWLGAKTLQPRSARTGNWHMMHNSTSAVDIVSPLPAEVLPWNPTTEPNLATTVEVAALLYRSPLAGITSPLADYYLHYPMQQVTIMVHSGGNPKPCKV